MMIIQSTDRQVVQKRVLDAFKQAKGLSPDMPKEQVVSLMQLEEFPFQQQMSAGMLRLYYDQSRKQNKHFLDMWSKK